MKKWIAILLALVLCLGLLTACGSKAEEPAAEAPAESGETTTFTVGFDAEYAPYGYMGEDGEYTGFDLEMAEAV